MSQQIAADCRPSELEAALKRKSIWVYPVGANYPLKARLAEAIRSNKLEWIQVSRQTPETFGQAFTRIFGESVTTITQGK